MGNRGVTNVKLTLRVNHPATDKMKLSFAFMTGLASAQYAQPMYQQQPAMGGMGNNMLLPLLLMDGGLGGSGSSNDLLLSLMLMGGMGGDASGMNNMLPLLLLGDGLGGSGSSNDLLLPLMLMGGMGGAGGDMGGMNGLLPLLLLGGDEVKTPADLTALCATVTDVAINAACTTAATAYATSHAAGMNSLLPLLLLGDGLGSGSGSSSDLLLPLMLMQQPQIAPATGQPMAGGLGGMDPMLTLLMLGDD